MHIAVAGYGVEGKSAAQYWRNLGHDVTVLDANNKLSVPDEYNAHLGEDYLKNLGQYDLISRSPGVHPKDIQKANPNLDQSKITSVTNEFLEQCPVKVIGVTGTKGKGTTSSLIAAILKQAGHTVHLGGNIGKPALDFLSNIQPEDWVVLELSSFQLMDARLSPHVAVMLMIAPDHMDWHPDMQEYITAKQNIFAHQGAGDRAIYNACNIYSLEAGLGAPGDQMAFNAEDGAWCDGKNVNLTDKPICSVDDIGLIGRHNRDNVCAAVAATWPIIEDAEPIKQAVKAFQGLEHRLEKVREVDGVTYIDDSYSVNPETARAAISAFQEPKVVVLGGFDRKHDYNRLAQGVRDSSVKHVILVGATSPQMVKTLEKVGFSNYSLGTGSMNDIVKLAQAHAKSGDVVIFSPGAPSFDMYTNFKERGDAFKQAVAKLQ